VETFYIAGGFGRYLHLESGAKIGLIPQTLLPRSKVVGNASHRGASMLLQQKRLISLSKEIAAKARTVELSANPIFAENFVRYIMFE